jgi:glycerol-3-phosphate dehydrogenase
MKNFDVIIIGGGVVGCMTARALARYDLKILLIEKNCDIGMGASSANSAIIHSGHDPVPGTLKAEMNTRANPMWDQISAELGIPFKRSGAYIVAIDEDIKCLDSLHQRAKENGVTTEIISADEMKKREPLINSLTTGALYTPTAGLIDPFAACIAPLENAMLNGVEVLTDHAFQNFIMEGNIIKGIHTSKGDFGCRWVINAAGLYSDDIIHKTGERPDFKITPRRGEYYVLDKSDIEMNNVLFPVPSEFSKGILVLGSTHGNAVVGPNSNQVQEKDDIAVTQEGLTEIWKSAQKLVPSINPRSIIATFAGMRATGNARSINVNYSHDFVIEVAREVQGLVNLAGIESPGLTGAPAIALRVVDLLKDAGEKLVEKKNFNPIRQARPRFNHLTHEEQAALVAKDPRYGRIVCRCEMITEGEIVAEIHAPLPAHTYDSIKRRTWLGTGRCLGSFDMPRVVSILSQELGISPLEVTKKGAGSEFLFRATKEVEA